MIQSDGKQKEVKPRRLDPPIINARSLLVLLLILLVPGCSAVTQDSFRDRSFLTGEPCEPPCWYGLEASKSIKEDVLTTLKRLPFIDQASIKELRTVWGDKPATAIEFACLHPKRQYCGDALIFNGKLKGLRLAIVYELTVETAVQKLGTPDYLDYSLAHAIVGGSRADLFWPGKGIMVEYVDANNKAVYEALGSRKPMPRNTPVIFVLYLSSEDFYRSPGDCCTRIPWPGFDE